MTLGLSAIQTALQQHLLEGGPGALALIASRHGIAPGRRLQIYHHAYRARLIDALRDGHSHTAMHLGVDGFDADALAFVESHPSTRPNLNDYGSGFAAWLHQRHPRDPGIGELARLDWALRRVFDGLDAKPLELGALAAVAPAAWSRIGFSFVPTCARLALTHNTLALWHALEKGGTAPQSCALAQTSELLIWRRGHQSHFRSIGVMEAQALAGLQQGLSFAAVCSRLATQFPQLEASVEAGSLLRRWIEEEILCAVVDPAAAY